MPLYVCVFVGVREYMYLYEGEREGRVERE